MSERNGYEAGVPCFGLTSAAAPIRPRRSSSTPALFGWEFAEGGLLHGPPRRARASRLCAPMPPGVDPPPPPTWIHGHA